ncbi:hypothetical protein [Streptomyces sp. NPDC055886]
MPITALSAAALLLGTTAETASAAPSSATLTTRVWSDGFEQPVVPAPQPFTGIAAGQSFGPWTVTGGSVDLVSDRPAVDDVTIRSCLLVLCLHKGTQLSPHSK